MIAILRSLDPRRRVALLKGELRRAIRLLDRERKRTALLEAILADREMTIRRLRDILRHDLDHIPPA